MGPQPPPLQASKVMENGNQEMLGELCCWQAVRSGCNPIARIGGFWSEAMIRGDWRDADTKSMLYLGLYLPHLQIQDQKKHLKIPEILNRRWAWNTLDSPLFITDNPTLDFSQTDNLDKMQSTPLERTGLVEIRSHFIHILLGPIFSCSCFMSLICLQANWTFCPS